MKLQLTFNGAQASSDQLIAILASAGANTSININTAQSIPTPALKKIIQAAGSKNLNLEFNGAQLSGNQGDQIKQALAVAGAATTISINTAQAVQTAVIVSIIRAAGSKKLHADFDGAQLSGNPGDQLKQALAAAGANTGISVNNAQSLVTSNLVSVVQSARSKRFSAAFNGSKLSGSPGDQIKQVLLAAGVKTNISVSQAQAIFTPTLVSVVKTAASKNLNLSFVGSKLSGNSGDQLKQVLAVAGANTRVSLNSAQSLQLTALISIIQAAGSKKFGADYNGTQLSGSAGGQIKQAVAVAGINTVISVNTAQIILTQMLISIIQAARSKTLAFDFNGAQASANQLAQATAVAGANITISVNTAQVQTTASLMALVRAAG
ncbi:hypothetical protein [Pseudomonas sp. OA65]|uniref:hypothetical protein n=1 Tax=Pseudomonas sp. OA65 TaxID=2818431 RepID=UPI001A9D9238|nr:hypothetical protein [Pseudomonas sp. OA65]MBO1540647.1 hypothetical protein [Pseudomonas sp. OA65]